MTTIFISLSRNVIDDVAVRCHYLSNQHADLEMRKWVTTVFKNWVVNEGPSTLLTSLADLPKNPPAWAIDALENNDLYRINWDACEALLLNVSDYFAHLKQNGQNFERVTVPDAIARSKAWHDELAAGAGAEKAMLAAEDGASFVLGLRDGFTWMKLTGKKSLDREGRIMGHCVGSYFEQVSDGDTTIYSLRDAKNGPHITVEVARMWQVSASARASGLSEITQIKGKANKEVATRYREFVLPLLGKLAPELHRIYLDESGVSETEARSYFESNKLFRFAVNKDIVPKGSLVLTTESGRKISFVQVLTATLKKPGLDPFPLIEGPNKHGYASSTQSLVSIQCSATGKSFQPFLLDDLSDFRQVVALAGLEKETPKSKYNLFEAVQGHFEGTKAEIPHTFLDFDVLLSQSTAKMVVGDVHVFTDTKKVGETALGVNSDLLLVTRGANGLAVLRAYVDTKGRVWDVRDYEAYEALVKRQTAAVFLAKLWEANLEASRPLYDLLASVNAQVKSSRAIGVMMSKWSKALSPSGEDSSKPAVRPAKQLDHSLLTPPLRGAISVFAVMGSTTGSIVRHAKALDNVPAIPAFLKYNKLKSSGYLYTYFDTFLALAFMSDKSKSVPYVLEHPSMLKQFVAFTEGGFGSIKAGAFYNRSHGEQTKIEAAWKKIAEAMPQLFPLTHSEKEVLLSIKGTPAFKKAITTQWA